MATHPEPMCDCGGTLKVIASDESPSIWEGWAPEIVSAIKREVADGAVIVRCGGCNATMTVKVHDEGDVSADPS